MIIGDTSAWMEYFKDAGHPLVRALQDDSVGMHGFVFGELVCGGLTPKHNEFDLINRLPMVPTVSNEEVIDLVIGRRLGNVWLGWTGAHLLAAALVWGHSIMSHDKGLIRAAV